MVARGSSSSSSKKQQANAAASGGSHPQEHSKDHRQFLVRSLERNDTDLAALTELNRSLHKARESILQSSGELVLLDLGAGRLTLINDELHEETTTRATTGSEDENVNNNSNNNNANANPVTKQTTTKGEATECKLSTATPTHHHLTPAQKELCVDFLLRMKLRRKLCNRLARRLNRIAHAMDGQDVNPPPPPRYGDLRLNIDPNEVQSRLSLWERQEKAKQTIAQAKLLKEEKAYDKAVAMATASSASVAVVVAPELEGETEPEIEKENKQEPENDKNAETTNDEEAKEVNKEETTKTEGEGHQKMITNEKAEEPAKVDEESQKEETKADPVVPTETVSTGPTKEVPPVTAENSIAPHAEVAAAATVKTEEATPMEIETPQSTSPPEAELQTETVPPTTTETPNEETSAEKKAPDDVELSATDPPANKKEVDKPPTPTSAAPLADATKEEAAEDKPRAPISVVAPEINIHLATEGEIPLPLQEAYDVLKEYEEAFEKIWDPATKAFKYKMANETLEPDFAAIKDGAGVGATARLLNEQEREQEHKRWQAALLGKIPDQPTFEELGMKNRVFCLEERRKRCLEEANEDDDDDDDDDDKEEEENDDKKQKDKVKKPGSKKRKTDSEDDDDDDDDEDEDDSSEDDEDKMEVDKDKSDDDDEDDDSDDKESDEEEAQKIAPVKKIAGKELRRKSEMDTDEAKADETGEDKGEKDPKAAPSDGDKKDSGDQTDSNNDGKKKEGSTAEKTAEEKKKAAALEEEAKPKRPMSLAPVPSFHDQDMSRIRTIHGDLLTSSMLAHARERLSAVTMDYNNAFQLSNQLYEHRTRLSQNFNFFVQKSRQDLAKANQEYNVAMTLAKQKWIKEKQEHDEKRMQAALPSRWNRAPFGTNAIQNYMRRPGGVASTIAMALADVVDGSILIAEKKVPNPKFMDFKPPANPSVNPQTGESLPQQHMRLEQDLRKQLQDVSTRFQTSEEDRKRAWRKMMKTKAELELPNQQQSKRGKIDLSNYHLIPLPPLRQSSQQVMPRELEYARSALPAYTPPRAQVDAEAAGSDSKYSAARVKERISSDGTVAPVTEPKKTKDGLYLRPAGRTRKGMQWDAVRGIWVPDGTH